MEEHLVQSGRYAQLSDVLREKLQGAGWYDSVLAYAGRELSVAETPRHDSPELEAIRRRALQMVPEEVKVEMLQLIMQIVDEQVEKT